MEKELQKAEEEHAERVKMLKAQSALHLEDTRRRKKETEEKLQRIKTEQEKEMTVLEQAFAKTSAAKDATRKSAGAGERMTVQRVMEEAAEDQPAAREQDEAHIMQRLAGRTEMQGLTADQAQAIAKFVAEMMLQQVAKASLFQRQKAVAVRPLEIHRLV